MRSKACATRQHFSIESTASALMSGDVLLGSRSKHTVYSTKLRYFILIVIQRDDREIRKAHNTKNVPLLMYVGLNEYYSLIVALLRIL